MSAALLLALALGAQQYTPADAEKIFRDANEAYLRGDFPQAASAFAEGYQRAPQGPKAPDNLLKMGMSLGNSGKKQEACFSFARLERDFPQMPPIIKDREVSEKKRIGC